MWPLSFILYSRQLRWYDSMEDSSIKGVIELSEVETVKPVPHKTVQGAPKKMDESAFFEVSIFFFFFCIQQTKENG